MKFDKFFKELKNVYSLECDLLISFKNKKNEETNLEWELRIINYFRILK